MNILIDGRPLVATSAGITNFLLGSLRAWAKLRPNDSFLVAMPHRRHETLAIANMPENIHFEEHSNWLSRHLPNLIWLCCVMPLLARRKKADIYFSPLPCLPFFLPASVKKIIVVHDVVNLEFSTTMQWTNKLSNALFFSRSIRNTDVIWTNSQYTRERVEHYFPDRKCDKIFSGCSIDRDTYHPLHLTDSDIADLKKRMGIKHQFILFVGSLEPRKNLSFLLSLMPQLYHEYKLQLVIVGGRGWKNSSISNLVNEESFPKESTIFCGYVSNEELAQLYHIADCFVSASLNEGFGMPQLEALLCGCPIVTAHNSAMIEVAAGKDGAVTVEGYHPKIWIDTIMQMVNTRPQVNISQLDAYDWDVIVSKLLLEEL